MSNEPTTTTTAEQQAFNPFPAAQWIAWIGATVAAALTGLAFAYSTFETKDNAHEHMGTVEQRLDRLETKLDRVIEQTRPK